MGATNDRPEGIMTNFYRVTDSTGTTGLGVFEANDAQGALDASARLDGIASHADMVAAFGDYSYVASRIDGVEALDTWMPNYRELGYDLATALRITRDACARLAAETQERRFPLCWTDALSAASRAFDEETARERKARELDDTVCPRCGSEQISSSLAENDEPGLVVQVSDCAVCGAEWRAEYRLSRRVILTNTND